MHLPSIETFYPYILSLIRVVVILTVALIGSRISGRIIRGARVAHRRRDRQGTPPTGPRRSNVQRTIGALLRKVVTVLIWTMATIMIVKELGFDAGPLLAGAGVAGLAIGFGAQNLVRDVVSGLFICWRTKSASTMWRL